MVFSLGELLVEIFRKGRDVPFGRPGEFLGPYPSGAPAIFAHAISCLSYPTGFFAAVGKDSFGECLLTRMQRSGVDTTWIVVLDNWTTGAAFTHFRGNGSREFIYYSTNAAVGQLGPEHLDRKALANCEWLHLCGNVLGISKKTRQASYEAAQIVHENGGRISFDPNIRFEMMEPKDIWAMCKPIVDLTEVLLPSGYEAEYLAGIKGEDAACKCLLDRGPKVIALKRGEAGSKIFTSSTEFEIPSFSVSEIDPTGAGDCFDAGLVYGLLHGWDLRKAGRFANALGALTVTKQGAMEVGISLQEVIQFMRAKGDEI